MPSGPLTTLPALVVLLEMTWRLPAPTLVPPEYVLFGFCMTRMPETRLIDPPPVTTPLRKVGFVSVNWLAPVRLMGPTKKMRLVVPRVTTLLLKLNGLARAKLAPTLLLSVPAVSVTAPLPRALTLPRITLPVPVPLMVVPPV